MWELALLLLPVAAGSGWYVGRKSADPTPISSSNTSLTSDYYKGLNYLLNEQADKALDAFIRMLDASPDTVETTLALGNFFRRRGEVDKAIRIHQNLIAKPNLNQKQKTQALLELAQDYMRAGVFDRAESLFQELLHCRSEELAIALEHLIDIFEREKDWEKAVIMAKRLQKVTGLFMGKQIAHYYCEIALVYWSKGRNRQALRQLKYALAHDKTCVRASIIMGNIYKSQQMYKQALKFYKQVHMQDSEFISEVIFNIQICYEKIGAKNAMVNYFEFLLQNNPNVYIILATAENYRRTMGEREATTFLAEHMRKKPSIRGIRHLVDYHLESARLEVRDDLLLLRSLMDKLMEARHTYRCGQCGLSTKTLNWQCPGCRQWSSTKPISRIDGES